MEIIMEEYKKDFIGFMIDSDVLTFGDFVTKSGRKTPFFINTGKYRTGDQIDKLGEFYAKAIKDTIGLDIDVIFGPAYKGIPLVVTTAIALKRLFDKDVAFCFNRKEVKDHGEGGSLIGHKLQDGDKVLIIEDVTTAGTSIYETVPVLKQQADVNLAGLVVSVNRMEKGQGEKTALKELADEFNMKTTAIVTMDDVVELLYNKPLNGKVHIDDELNGRIDEYYELYGAEE